MEVAVKKLEVLLSKTEYDMDKISVRLDEEFAQLANNQQNYSELDLSKILQNIRSLRTDLDSVSADIEAFQKSQKEIREEVAGQLSKLSDQFVDLKSVAAAAHDDNEA